MLENVLMFILGALIASWGFCTYFAFEFAKISVEWGKIQQAWLVIASAKKGNK